MTRMAEFEESIELLGEGSSNMEEAENTVGANNAQAKSIEAERSVGSKDPLLETIGEFGVYQFYVCLVGFFFTIPHCWVSLSLKFVGMRTSFTCADLGAQSLNDSCFGPSGPCQSFEYDQSQFRSTIIERWDLVCEKEGLDSIAQSVFFAGCLLGVFLSGILADMFGRKPVLVLLILMGLLSGVLGGLTKSFHVWLALRFLLGAASIGSGTVRFTIQVEMVGSKYRTWGNMFSPLGWSVGYMLLPVIAYIIPDMAQLEILIGMCFLPFISLYCLYPESPKWLLSVGRISEAEAVAENICYWNKRKFVGLSVSNKKLDQLEEKSVGLCHVIKYPSLRRNLICLALTWFSVGMVYFGIALHTPEFGSNVFMVFFLGGLIELPTNFMGPWFLNYFGRKGVMLMGFSVCSMCLLASGVVPVGLFKKEWMTVTLITLGKVAIGFCFESCYIWTSEIFPTVIRNGALSVCSSFARIGAIIAPLIVEIDKDNPMAPILIYGLVSLLAVFNTCLIYPESKNCDYMPNNLDEGEELCRRKHGRNKMLTS